MSALRRAHALGLLVVAAGACHTSSTEPRRVATAVVAPDTASFFPGTQRQLVAAFADEHGKPITGVPVTWRSSAATIATVSLTGIVTAVAPGTATVTATIGDKVAAADISVLAPVATVTLTPGALRIPPGDGRHLVVSLADAAGHALSGRTVTWSSSNTDVALVDPSAALAIGRRDGTAVLTATVEGKTASVSMTVSAEPDSLTMITDRPFNCIRPTECESDWDFYGSDQPTIHNDPTAPKSPPNVARITWHPGFEGGSGQGQTCRKLAHTTVYMSAWLQLSANFEGHPTGANKLFYIAMNGNQTFIVPEADGVGDAQLAPRFVLQNLAAPYQDQNGALATTVGRRQNFSQPVQIVRGEWHRYEYLLVMNTPGAPNGSIDAWQDGVRTFSLQNIAFIPANAHSTTFESICWQPIWGGQGGVVHTQFYMELDHVYISGK
ncbi:MAG TPA: Ig-like domain-containing protein [Gemmatimonadaceae bacterium]|nr:Ig-like domain-containing protein [Gemmatimonadaceae bacterium]